ncbi:MAG: hypothetical protein ABSA42_13195 [Terracidiphilus sp.]|jgi:hypothetical protein
MSTALFMGVRCSYGGEATNGNGDCPAAAFLDALNRVLAENGIERYDDPEETPRVYRGHLFGRSALDHHSPRVFLELVAIAEASAPRSNLAQNQAPNLIQNQAQNLALIRMNPHRAVFLPRALPKPLATGYCAQNGGEPAAVWAGSLVDLLRELLSLGHELRIPLANGELADETANAINMFRPFHELDSTKLIENYRTAWLALHEGARLALEHDVALTLAG